MEGRVRQGHRISIVSREDCLQDRQSGLIGGCGRKLKDRNGVLLSIIGAGLQQMSLMTFCPKVVARNRAGLFLREPRLDSHIGGFNCHAVVVDALLDPVELAFKDLLGLVEGRCAIRFEHLKAAVHPMKLDPQLVTKATDPLTHLRLPHDQPVMVTPRVGWGRRSTATRH